MPACLGQRRLLPHAEQDRLGIPQDQPDRDADQHGDPQALAHGAADVAHRMALAAEFGRHHRRRRIHQAEAEDQRREIEVGAERAGGDACRARPAHHHDVGRRHRDLGEVGQNHRPAQRERRANLRRAKGFPALARRLRSQTFSGLSDREAVKSTDRRSFRAGNPSDSSRSRAASEAKRPR